MKITLLKYAVLGFCAVASALSGYAADNTQKQRFFSYRSFLAEFDAMKDFAKKGVNTICLMPSNTMNSLGEPYCEYPVFWRGKNQYDWKVLDKQFTDALKANPNAQIICIVDLNSPPWLMRKMSFGHAMDSDSFSMLSNSLACPYWRSETTTFLKDYLKHLEENFGDKIKAYMIACGHTDEWFSYDHGVASPCKINAWHKWQKKNKMVDRDVPSISNLYKASFENTLRDPKTEQDCIDFVHFINDVVADAMIDFAKIAKGIVAKEKQIGAFFGYIHRNALDGHLEYERVFACKDFDFIVSPAVYSTRNMGESSGTQSADGTRKRYGKGWLHEIDHDTHTFNHNLSPYVSIPNRWSWKNQAETNAGLKREFAVATIENSSLWCFDMWGEVFNTPETMNVVERAREVWDKFSSDTSKNVAEIAIFADPQSMRYVNQMHKGNVNHVSKVRDQVSATGAPTEIFSFNDIGNVDLSKYKIFIFPQTYMLTPERRAILDKHILKNGNVVITTYAPAIIDGEKLDVENVKKFTGFEYGSKGVCKKDMGGWTSVYAHDYKDITAELIRTLGKEAGVHFYVEGLIPVRGNDRLLLVHVKDGGKKKVSLKKKYSKVVELYSNKVVAQNASEFEYDFASPDTALFELID